MHLVLPIIEEAWEHRRRRYRSFGTALLAAALVAVGVVALVSPGSGSNAGGAGPAERTGAMVAPSTVLSKPPYMGVSCPVANSIACDRVGLAVWLKRPATLVTATIAGARVSLQTGVGLADNLGTRGRAFVGYLQPAGIVSRLHVRPVEGSVITSAHGRNRVTNAGQMWFGGRQGQVPSASVQLTIHDGSGPAVRTRVRVPLSPGWG